MSAARRVLAMRALARLSLGSRAASSSSAAAQAAAAQAAAQGIPPETRALLGASPLALGVFSDSGRALVARRLLGLGDVLLEEMPLAATPSPERDASAQCHHCLRLLLPAAPSAAPGRSAGPREPAIREEEEEKEEQGRGDDAAAETTATASSSRRRRDDDAGVSFCGDACALAAEASYRRVERRVDLSQLREHCASARERFPLVAARLACAVLQSWESGGRERALARARGGGKEDAPPPSSSSLRRLSWLAPRQLRAVSAPAAAATTAARAPPAAAGEAEEDQEEAEDSAFLDAVAAEAAASQLAPMPAVAYLCRANLPPDAALALPAAWQRSHALLVRALGAMLDGEPPRSAARLLPAVRAVSAPGWYAQVLSRLHLNSFRVEAPATAPLMAAAATASSSSFTAALLQAASASPASQALGSAVYSAASLANHSCDPNADAAWPRGDARLRLTARRDIAPGEQVTITYVDASLGVEERRALLKHSYGFVCACARCGEEMAALPPDMPPLPR